MDDFEIIVDSIERLSEGTLLSSLLRFNDGSDGAYAPSSTGNLPMAVKRYTTINIPSGVTISPASGSRGLIFLVQGNCNIDGLLSASGKGAGGGGGGYSGSVATYNWADGSNGSSGVGFCGGGGGGGCGQAVYGSGHGGSTTFYSGGNRAYYAVAGTGSGPPSNLFMPIPFDPYVLITFCGAGGGGGSAVSQYANPYTFTGGTGGAGGGFIIIFADTITGSGAIRADGMNGGNGTGYYSPEYGVAAGGGGGGGGFIFLVARQTPTIATVSAVGGTKGSNYGTYTLCYSAGDGGPGLVLKAVV